jgi:outer membrane scaffolding protein for murein synthesis (MipA/OmpV family)
VKKYFFIWAFLFFSEHAFSADGLYLDLGAGADYKPAYSGSSAYGFSPVPVVELKYKVPWYEVYAGTINGIGGQITHLETGLFASAAIDFGDGRDVEDDNKILKNTANVKNLYKCISTFGWEFEYAELSLTAEYYPVTAEYKKTIGKDIRYNGFLVTPEIQSGLPVIENKMLLIGKLGCDVMNKDYADAYYGVTYETEKLKKYSPSAGIKSVQGEIQYVWYGVFPHVWMFVSQKCEFVTGDAAESPIVKNQLSSTTLAAMTYRFN